MKKFIVATIALIVGQAYGLKNCIVVPGRIADSIVVPGTGYVRIRSYESPIMSILKKYYMYWTHDDEDIDFLERGNFFIQDMSACTSGSVTDICISEKRDSEKYLFKIGDSDSDKDLASKLNTHVGMVFAKPQNCSHKRICLCNMD